MESLTIYKTYHLSFHSFKNLKAPAFWQKDKYKKYVVINVPSTYPAQEINGVLISGFISPSLEKAVYPPSYLKRLKSLNYEIDIDSAKAHKSRLLLFKRLFKTLDTRTKAVKHFWDEIDWNVFMVVLTGSDRLEHFLWDAYENEDHEWRPNFMEFFETIDKTIGMIDGKLKEKDSLIILSDHGMELVDTNVNINAYMAQEGFLELEHNPKRRYNNIKDGTKAFALEPARIYLNKAGKYPRGCVKPREENGLTLELVDSFNELERNGQKVVKKAYTKEELYYGKYVEDAPDLVLLPNPRFNLRASLFRKEIFEKDMLTGKHTQEDAFLYVKNGENRAIVPAEPSVEDVITVMNKLG